MAKVLLSLVVCFVPAALAQVLEFRLLPNGPVAPAPRVDGTIAYDSSSRRIFLFGGRAGSPANDLWAYSLDRREWSELAVPGTRPPARFGHTLILDRRGRLIVFGGQASGFFSDVWALDTGAMTWRQLAPNEAGPSDRYGHSAVYDRERDQMIISHGFTDAGRFDDTWAFNLSANTWRNLSPAGQRPIRRCLHHAVFHDATQRMLLYGGCASGFGPCPLGDLWEFDLATNRWTERRPANPPPPREHYGIGFDARRGRLVLFGGSGGGLLNDTWTYEPATDMWRRATIAGDSPPARSRHESAFAPELGAAFFFGGRTAAGLTNELWMLGAPSAGRPELESSGIRNSFSGAAGPIAPGELVSIFGSGLGPLPGVSFGFDAEGRLPTSGPGVTVLVNGTAAPLLFVSATQINLQVPYEADSSREAEFVVIVNGASSSPIRVPVQPAGPGLWPIIYNEDSSANSSSNAARPGTIVVLYATGLGATAPRRPSGVIAREPLAAPLAETVLTIGGRPARVIYIGEVPETVGVIQINARIPAELSEHGTQRLVLTCGGVQSQAAVAVRDGGGG